MKIFKLIKSPLKISLYTACFVTASIILPDMAMASTGTNEFSALQNKAYSLVKPALLTGGSLGTIIGSVMHFANKDGARNVLLMAGGLPIGGAVAWDYVIPKFVSALI